MEQIKAKKTYIKITIIAVTKSCPNQRKHSKN